MNLQRCRGCDNYDLVQILDLGFAPPSNALLNSSDLAKGELHYPLILLFCDLCKLVQTKDFHSGEMLFTSNYPYLSSTSTSWIKHSHELVDSLIEQFNLNETTLVAEIASNDGYLLERLVQRNIPHYGIEPTEIAANISVEKGHNVYKCFLNIETASQIRQEKGAADVVIANNVFAHVPELRNFTEAARILLSQNGIMIIEVQDFTILLEKVLFDTVYHEHYSYFTLSSITNLLEKHQLGIFKVEHVNTHGGSIRVYAKNNSVSSLPQGLQNFSRFSEGKATNLQELLKFQYLVDSVKRRIKDFFFDQESQGKVVAGLGAAAKGNTLINFLKLGRDDIRYVFDSAPSKQGLFLPGSHIPVYPLKSLGDFSDIDTLIALPWNIAEELANEVFVSQSLAYPIYRLMPETKLISQKA